MCAPDLGWAVQLLICSLTEIDVGSVTDFPFSLKPGVGFDDRLYGAIHHSLEHTQWLTELACGSTWVTGFLYFYSTFFEYPLKWCVCLKRWNGWCHVKALVFLIVLYVSLYRWVHFSRAVLSSQWWYDDESDMLCCWTRLQFLWPCLD